MLKKLCIASVAMAAMVAAPTMAQDDDEPHFLGGNFSANVAIATDYTFRGISQSSGDPVVQGGIDWASDIFYIGTWASTVDFNDDIFDPFLNEEISDGSSIELDLYAGFTPTIGDFSLDFGVIYYLYPGAPQGADDVFVPDVLTPETQLIADALGLNAGDAVVDFRDQNYTEIHGGGSYPLGPVEIGFNLTYSPDYYFAAGDVLIPDLSVSFPLGGSIPVAGSDLSFAFSGNIGYLAFLDDDRVAATDFFEDYWDFGVGVTATWYGIDFDARFIDTFGLAGNGSTGVFTISKAF